VLLLRDAAVFSTLPRRPADARTPAAQGKRGAVEKSTPMADERRIAKRFAIQLNKITGAEVTRDSSATQSCYVYVADISEGGLRITTDSWFDPGEQFGLHLQLNPPLNGRVEVVWSKQLTGGTNVYGVKFVEMSDALRTQVKTFIDSFSEEARRKSKSVNLNRVVCMQFPELTHDKRTYVLTNVLSSEGMQVTAETAFDHGRAYDCLLFLEPDQPPVVVRAVARAVQKAVCDRFKVTFDFERMSTDGTARINAFLDKVISGEIDRQVMTREVDFDEN
jgi:hypothetical protein